MSRLLKGLVFFACLIPAAAFAQIDLRMDSVSLSSPSTFGTNKRVTVRYRVRNTGTKSASAFIVGFYYGDTTATSNLTLVGGGAHALLGAGKFDDRSVSFVMPGNVLLGRRYIHYWIDYKQQVAETSESNNRGSLSLVITGRPDFYVVNQSRAPGQVSPGGSVSVWFQIQNVGGSRGDNVSVGIYFSTDRTITNGAPDILLKRIIVPRVNYSLTSRQTISVRIPTNAPSGTRFLGIYIDDLRRVQELNENNNTHPLGISVRGIPGTPDLLLSKLSLSSSGVLGYRSKVTVAFTVKNQGRGGAGGFYIRYYYGDTTNTSNLSFLSQFYIPSLLGGRVFTRTLVVVMPANVLYGQRRIHYFVDFQNKVKESNETNNRGSTAINITGKPDLRVFRLSINPGIAKAGQQIGLIYGIRNYGPSRTVSSFSIDVSLIVGAGTSAQTTRLSRFSSGVLFADYSGSGTPKVTIPSTTPAGDHLISMKVDSASVIIESNEKNNIKNGKIKILPPPKPDLYMASFRLSSSSARGYLSRITIYFAVRNGQAAKAGVFRIAFYYGDSKGLALSYLGAIPVSGLSGGKTSALLRLIVVLPNTVLYGKGYIHARIDDRKSVAESNENNNHSYAALTITGKPDLQVSSLSLGATSAIAGARVRVHFLIRNMGYSRVDSVTSSVYFSADSLFSGGAPDNLLVSVTNVKLMAQGTGSWIRDVTIPSNAKQGKRYLYAYADSLRKVSETNESNNAQGKALNIVSKGLPDIVMQKVTIKQPSVTGSGSRITVNYTVKNQGSTGASGFRVTLLFENGGRLTSAGLSASLKKFSGLGAGKTVSSSFVYTLPKTAAQGTSYFHSIVDHLNFVPESNERNNQVAHPFKVNAPVDIAVSYLTATPTSTTAGSKIVLSYRLTNYGKAQNRKNNFVSFHSSFKGDKPLYYHTRGNHGVIAAGATTKIYTIAFTLSRTLPTGPYYYWVKADDIHIIPESNEKNNLRRVTIQIRGLRPPDLTPSYFKLSVSRARGFASSMTASFRVKNIGDRDAGKFNISFYYTDTVRFGGRAMYSTSISSLKARTETGLYKVTFKLPNNVLYGKRFIHMLVDSGQAVKESNEANNRAVRNLEITGKPELQVFALKLSPSSQIPGGYLSASYRVSNFGYSRADKLYVSFYYAHLSSLVGKKLLFKASLGSITARTHRPSQLGYYLASLRVPGNARVGKRYILAYVDPNSYIAESNEKNNGRTGSFSVIAQKPDLTIHSTGGARLIGGYQSRLTLRYKLRNIGNADAKAFTVLFAYGDTSQLSGLTKLAEVNLLGIKRRSNDSTRTVVLTFPRNVLYGPRFIHILIDSKNVISEQNETNNNSLFSFVVNQGPNLIVSDLGVNPSAQSAGSTIKIRYQLENNGSARTGRSVYVGFYLSSNGTLDSKDVLLRTVILQNLLAKTKSPAGSSRATFSVNLPRTAKPGNAYIIAFVDRLNQLAEKSEKDNTRSTLLRILGKSDLVASKILLTPSTQLVGKKVKVQYTVSNHGHRDVTGFNVKIYLSKIRGTSSRGSLLSSFNLGRLALGKSVSGIRTVTLPSGYPKGRAYVGLWVDAPNAISESNEKNNIIQSVLAVLVDEDKDGHPNTTDCDDSNAKVYPGAPELCDGLDNNCNQKIDENPKCVCKSGRKRQCYTLGKGCSRASNGKYSCKGLCKSGIQACKAGKWEACIGEVTPKTESCDGKDNNCDGLVDDNVTRSCYDGPSNTLKQGVCKEGSQACSSGKWGACKNQVKPSQELCDGKDNNCDGKIDQFQRSCYSGVKGTLKKGVCKAGMETCKSSKWSICVGEKLPSQELCDGLDNDCDGQIDNSSQGSSLSRSCSTSCGSGIEVCLSGQYQNCSAPKTCHEQSEESSAEVYPEPSSEEVTGDSGVLPESGESIPEADCYTNGCPKDEVCSSGKCIPDPCLNKQCKDGKFCRAGRCVSACGCLRCGEKQKCIDGKCTKDLCAKVTCKGKKVCDASTGKCIGDACDNVTCGSKRICRAGSCVDAPCSNIQCPNGMSCQKGQCIGQSCQEATESSSESSEETVTEPSSESAEEPVVDNRVQNEKAQNEASEENVSEAITEAGDGGSSEQEPEYTTDLTMGVGGGCGCSTENRGRLPIFFMFSLVLFLLPFARRRR